MTRVLAGRYRLVRKLGAGAMGQVWLVHDELLQRDVAIKELLLDESVLDAADIERAMREARMAGRLHHPGAVAVHDLLLEAGRPILVMEYVEGQTLAQLLRTRGRLPVAEVADVFIQVAQALTAAHELGIIHRDVKPANIMITSGGGAKLADFGIARSGSEATLTSAGMMMGTVAYMAPEVARGEAVTTACDVWSLGASLFQAVEGVPLFPGTNAADSLLRLVTDPVPVPTRAGPMTDLIRVLLDRVPAQRPTAAEAADVLAALGARASTRKASAEPRPVADGRDPTVVLGPRPAQPAVAQNPGVGTDSDPSIDPSSAVTLQRAKVPPSSGDSVTPPGSRSGEGAKAERPERSGARLGGGAPPHRRRSAWAALIAALVLVALGATALLFDSNGTRPTADGESGTSEGAPQQGDRSGSPARAPLWRASGAYRAVIFEMWTAPEDADAALEVLRGGEWRVITSPLEVRLDEGGQRTCIRARANAGSAAAPDPGPEARLCGRSEGKRLRLSYDIWNNPQLMKRLSKQGSECTNPEIAGDQCNLIPVAIDGLRSGQTVTVRILKRMNYAGEKDCSYGQCDPVVLSADSSGRVLANLGFLGCGGSVRLRVAGLTAETPTNC